MFRFPAVNKKILAAFFLVIGIFVLLSPEIKGAPRFYFFERPFAFSINVVQSGFTSIFNSISSVWSGYISLTNVNKDNKRLLEENKRLRNEQIVMLEKALAADRLLELLRLKDTIKKEYVIAGITAKDPASWSSVVVINKGERDGLRPGMGVINEDGVVGRVIKTTPSYSRVLLISDRNSSVAGLIQRTRDEGIVAGAGGSPLRLNYITITSDVLKGDIILTSGTDSVFPEGIVIGSISKIETPKNAMFHSIEVLPGVNLSKVREVMVLKTPPAPEIERMLKDSD
ncbi:MAG: rod shape-determining protein MreC [Nitrospirae bacterium]|nr:rod shape-determining protein MreC [Nitrospirota bacterium]